MLSWFTPKKPTQQNPVKILKSLKDVRDTLLKADNDKKYGLNSRQFKCPVAIALNFFLYYITQRSLEDKVQYKVTTMALLEFIDYCHFNSRPEDWQYTRIACGASHNGAYYYYTLVSADESNPVLTAGLEFEHTAFNKVS